MTTMFLPDHNGWKRWADTSVRHWVARPFPLGMPFVFVIEDMQRGVLYGCGWTVGAYGLNSRAWRMLAATTAESPADLALAVLDGGLPPECLLDRLLERYDDPVLREVAEAFQIPVG
jgi:hypothetical protein